MILSVLSPVFPFSSCNALGAQGLPPEGIKWSGDAYLVMATSATECKVDQWNVVIMDQYYGPVRCNNVGPFHSQG